MDSREKIRVMHVVTRMNVGGVAVLINNLLSGMDSQKFEVLLVTGTCELPEGEYLDGLDISYAVNRIPTFHKSFSPKDDLRTFFELRSIIKEFKPDVIHTHTSKAGVFGRISSLLFAPHARRVHTFHGHLLVGYFNPLKLTIVKSVERVLGLLSTKLVAMGTQVRDDLVNAGIAPNSKFEVFFPGLRESIPVSRDAARKSLGLSADVIYCIFIGRMTQIKRPDRVIDIAKKLKGREPRIEILMVGDGELGASLKQTVEAEGLSVQFLGWRSDINLLLAAADLLLLTSDNEAVALTLIEASQAGIPVVTTSAGSVRDIAVDGFNGYVTGFNIDELTSAVVELAKSPNLRSTMGANGKSRANEFFSVESMVDSHQELYKELLRL